MEVHGMTCGGCERALSKRLALVPGAGVQRVNHVSGSVTLTRDSSLSPSAEGFEASVREAVDDAGFELVQLAIA